MQVYKIAFDGIKVVINCATVIAKKNNGWWVLRVGAETKTDRNTGWRDNLLLAIGDAMEALMYDFSRAECTE